MLETAGTVTGSGVPESETQEEQEPPYEASRSARDARALWLEEEFARRLGERQGGG